MNHSKYRLRVLWFQGAAFLAIIAISWLNEWIGLPEILTDRTHHAPNWAEPVLESGVTALVWLVTFLITRRLLVRLHYMEGFLRVCAWCHKVYDGKQWVPLERFFEKGFCYPDLAWHVPGLRATGPSGSQTSRSRLIADAASSASGRCWLISLRSGSPGEKPQPAFYAVESDQTGN